MLLPPSASASRRVGPAPGRLTPQGVPHDTRPRRRVAVLCLAWPTSPAVAGERGGIVVRVSPGTTTARLRGDLSARGLSLATQVLHTDVYAVSTGGRTPTAALRLVRDASHIVGAEPDHVVRAFETPNDPFFDTAESYLSTLRLPQAWELTHGPSESSAYSLSLSVRRSRGIVAEPMP